MESTLGTVNRCYVYKVPPAKTSAGHYAREWDLETPITPQPLRLRVVERNNECVIKLEDPSSGQLFAECVYNEASVQSVLDSSRYFVITLTNARGQRALVGLGFQEKTEAFDFNAAIDTFKRYQRQEAEAKRAAEQWQSQPRADYSIPEGGSIHINLKVSKPPKKEKTDFPTGGAFALAPPPSAGAGRIAPPPQQHQQPAFNQQQQYQSQQSQDPFGMFSTPQQNQAPQPQQQQNFGADDWTDFSSTPKTTQQSTGPTVKMNDDKDHERETKMFNTINKKLIETGERERIKEWARAKLYEAGWREQLKRDGIECVMKKGRENVTVDDLLSTLGDKYRDNVSTAIKAEMLQRIRSFLAGAPTQLSSHTKEESK